MKKRIALLIMILVVAMLFGACSGDIKKDPLETATPKVTQEAEPTPEPTPTVEPTPVPTREPDPEFDGFAFHFFHEYDNGHFLILDESQCDYEYVEGKGLAIYPESEDPWVLVELAGPDGEEVNIIDYPVIKLRFQNKTPGIGGEFFMKRTEGVVAGDLVSGIKLVANEEDFSEYIINLASKNGKAFVEQNGGVAVAIRLDLVNLTPAKSEVEDQAGTGEMVIYLDYFAFFKSVEDAENWVPSHLA